MFTLKTSSASARALVPSRSVATVCGVAIVVASGAFLSGCSNETSDINDLTAPAISMDQLSGSVSQLTYVSVSLAGDNTESVSIPAEATHVVVACNGGSVKLSIEADSGTTRLADSPQLCSGKQFTYELPASEGHGSVTLEANGDIAAKVVFGTTK